MSIPARNLICLSEILDFICQSKFIIIFALSILNNKVRLRETYRRAFVHCITPFVTVIFFTIVITFMNFKRHCEKTLKQIGTQFIWMLVYHLMKQYTTF